MSLKGRDGPVTVYREVKQQLDRAPRDVTKRDTFAEMPPLGASGRPSLVRINSGHVRCRTRAYVRHSTAG